MTEPNIHAYCTDCGKKFDDKKFSQTAWFQSGVAAPCNMCGGVVAIIEEEGAQDYIASSQRKRGIVAPASNEEDSEEPYVV